MAAALQYTTEEQRYVVFSCWQKDSMQRTSVEKCSLFMVGSICRVKRFTSGSIHFLKDFRKSQMMPGPRAEVAEKIFKRLLCRGFRRTGKAMGQVYRCWWRICREINVFTRFEFHMFYVYIHSRPIYLLSLVQDITQDELIEMCNAVVAEITVLNPNRQLILSSQTWLWKSLNTS
jgi:hypothetical protein